MADGHLAEFSGLKVIAEKTVPQGADPEAAGFIRAQGCYALSLEGLGEEFVGAEQAAVMV